MKAVLRRHDLPQPDAPAASFVAGEITVDFPARDVVPLTPREYRVLGYLVRNADRVVRYETLLARAWGRDYVDEIDHLRVFIRRLRRKLERTPAHPRHILTERRAGYRFRTGP